MDPLSIPAGTIAILGLTTSIARETRSFYKEVKDASTEIAKFVEELDNLAVILKRLEDIARKAEENDNQYSDQMGANTEVTATARSGSVKSASRLAAVKKMMETDGPLCLCYKELLAFKDKLDKKDQSKLRRSIKWPFKKPEIHAITRRLNDLKSDLDMAINTDSIGLTINIQDELRITAHADARAKKSAANEDLVSKVSDWLSPPNASTNLETARNKRQTDTGNWLLESSVFIDWRTVNYSFLWLHGKAGSGKTILSSTVIHSLFDTSPQKPVVVYYYFDFQIRDKQTVQNFLKHCVVQLSNQNELTIRLTKKLYESHSEGGQQPTIKDLKEVIQRMMEVCPTIYLAVDALDECQERDSLLDFLDELQNWRQPNLHVFTTSRKETDIEDCLEGIATHTISLEESVVARDILSYIEHRLQNDRTLLKWPEDTKNEIKTTLLGGANGMFRWVECQLDAIRKCGKLASLRKALHSLPKTLDDTYARILDNLEEDCVEDVYRILSCLVCSFRPISTKELAEIIPIVAQGEVYYDVENRLLEPRYVLKMCSGLVITTKSSQAGKRKSDIEEVRLAHFSVKEYLVSDRIVRKETTNFHIEERLAHEVLAHLSIRYLIYCYQAKFCEDPDFLQTGGEVYLDRAAFAPYAASFWPHHVQAARLDSSSPIHKECLDMFSNPVLLGDAVKLRRLLCYGDDDHLVMSYCGYLDPEGPERPEHQYDAFFNSVPPLYYASLLGLDHLICLLLGKGEDPNCCTREGTCLAAAASRNYQSTVEILLANKADVNLVVIQTAEEDDPRYSRTAIYEAVWHSYESVVEVLLAAKADVNVARWPLEPPDMISRPDANTPLQVAVYAQNKKLVQLLLGAGADPNALGGYYGTALESAASHASDNVVMAMLLQAGADPNLTSISSGIQSPLFRTILFGNRINTYLLIEEEVDRQTIDIRIVYHVLYSWVAQRTELERILETLIQIRPDMSMDLALVTCAKYGYIKLLRLVLRKGTTPNAQEDGGTAALHAAAFTPGSDFTAVQLLLEADADVCLQGGPLGNALQAAALSGKSNVVSMLLGKGASIDYAGGLYGSALAIARVRLRDQQMGCPETWMGKEAFDILKYGTPPGYSSRCDNLDSTRDPALAKSPRDPAYEAKINIAHLSYADYQAIIDILLDHGAVDD